MRHARVLIALAELLWVNGIEELREAANVDERQILLLKILPQTSGWSPLPSRELAFRIQKKWQIDMGVCQFYHLSEDVGDKEQYCLYGGERISCLCPQPWQGFCVVRDADRQVMLSFVPDNV
jgi:hypothetical protein